MPSSHPSLSRPAAVVDSSSLDRLPPAGASHDDVRRYSRARRHVLPRRERVTAVAGGWGHEVVLRSGVTVEAVLWCPGERRHPTLAATAVEVAGAARHPVRISERTLGRIHPGLTAPALLSVVQLPRWQPSLLREPGTGLVLVADGIEYAGNLGTLIRTADACAVDALVVTRGMARLTHPQVFVASRGTVLTTPVLEYADVALARADLAAAGYTTYVADPAGTTPYRSAGLGAGRTAVVVGSEGGGVDEQWRTGLTRVSIPMRGRADSLNVAASAAVLLFEARAETEKRASGRPWE